MPYQDLLNVPYSYNFNNLSFTDRTASFKETILLLLLDSKEPENFRLVISEINNNITKKYEHIEKDNRMITLTTFHTGDIFQKVVFLYKSKYYYCSIIRKNKSLFFWTHGPNLIQGNDKKLIKCLEIGGKK